MACACGDYSLGLEFARGESHHQKTGLVCRVISGIGALEGHWRGGGGKKEFFEVLFVEGYGVCGLIPCIGFGAELCADGDLGGETDDGNPDAVLYQGGQGVVNIARVRRQEGSVDY